MEPSPSNESQNDIEVLKKKEDEHFRLQRQFKMIQTDRTNRTMGVHPQFRRQDLLLRALKQEYISMSKNLKIASTGAHKRNTKRMKADLQRSLLLRMKTEQECEGGYTMMRQLDGLLQNDNRYVQQLKSRVDVCLGEMKERQQQSERRLKSTENRLEVANMRFNAVQCENKRIREEIEHMLKERDTFNKDWSKMMTALSKGKKFLTDLFESSSVAYDQRDEWCAKLRSMTEKGRMDQMLQTQILKKSNIDLMLQEMRDLQKAFDHEMKLFYFLGKKGVMRINKRQERREQENQQKELEKVQADLNYHLDILNEINEYTQESSTKAIADGFQRIEQDNFSIYKLICEYCAENEVLKREVARIRQEVADRRDWNESKEQQRQANLQKMKQQLEERVERNEELRRRTSEQQQVVDRTVEEICDIFKMLDLSLEPFQNLLGDKQPSIHHLKLTLCLISDKVKELIATVYYIERTALRKDKSSTSRLKKYTVHAEPRDYFQALPMHLLVPADPCPACTEARWLSRLTEAPEQPLSLEGALAALRALHAEPAYERSDRVHPLADCRLPASRLVLAKRYL